MLYHLQRHFKANVCDAFSPLLILTALFSLAFFLKTVNYEYAHPSFYHATLVFIDDITFRRQGELIAN